jgi:acetylornithine deacetylase/succinyl-diaminopimelate desuccinylase-like protein
VGCGDERLLTERGRSTSKGEKRAVRTKLTVPREEIRQELERVIAMPVVKVTATTGEDSISAPASPMRPDFVNAVEKAMHLANQGLAIFPSQASGASDSMWYRALGVPSYGASPTFSKDSEDCSHGLNERVPLSNIAPGLTYYVILFTDLSK